MPNPARVVAVLVLAAACSAQAPDPAAQPSPVATRPAPTEAVPTPTATTQTTPPVTSVADTESRTALEPDFSGTGCFPSDPPLPVEVVATPESLGAGRVRIRIAITSTQTVVVEHRHGQEVDASVDRDGEEIWRWSTVAPFVDPYGYDFTYEPDETRRFSVVWDGGDQRADTVHGFWVADVKTPEPPGRVICFDDAPIA